jgi:Secretion system C-terminal sorting domain
MENSEVIVQEGGKLIIDPDANVALDNSSVAGSSDSRIVTKKNGELIFTGLNAAGLNFTFSGNGHFAFDYGHILNIQTSTLSLRGMGKNTRFIRLNGGAKLKLKNKNIRLENGQIEYLSGSGIVGEEGISTVNLSNISAKPSSGKGSFGTAFEFSYSKGAVTIINSDFIGMGIGCHLRGTEYNVLISNSLFENCTKGFFSTVNYGAIDIRTNTRFIDNIVGCQIDANSGAVNFSFVQAWENAAGVILRGGAKLDIVNMTNCNIARNGTAGIIVDNIPSLVLQDCVVEFHNNKSRERHNQNVLEYAGQNVIINIPECETDLSSNVIEFSAGIYDMQNSNIIVTYGTTIKDNNYGIFKNTNYFIQGGASLQDAVILNCMTLSNNYFGVKGSNIELQADAFSSGGTPNWSINPNRFVLGEGKYLFDICYDGKSAPIPKVILIRENYWETKAGAGKAPDPMSINFKSACVDFCEHCSNLGNCIPYETAPENTNPTDCIKGGKPNPTNPNFVDVAAQGATSLTVMGYLGENTPVHAQYRSAFATLLQGKTSNIEDAMQRFATIAALPITAETDNVGAQYIRVARAFVDYNSNGGEIQTLSRVQKTRAVIYPNPTDNVFSINLEKGAYAISIVDMQGRVVYQQNTEGNLEVETEKWLSGVYQIFITNKNTGAETTEKVVVMKY